MHALEYYVERVLPKNILLQYWDVQTDHSDFRIIIDTLKPLIGSDALIDVLNELDKAGFKIVRK